jgi:hypothetical protein
MKKQNHIKKQIKYDEDWDFSEGFGGIPEEIDLKHNLGCASGRGKKEKKPITDKDNSKK